MRLVFISLLVTLLGTVAFGQQVNYNYDQDTDFSKYKSYRWVEIEGGEQVDQLTERQIQSALDAELAKKGLAKTDSEDADLSIGYQVALNQEKQFMSFNSGWGYGPGWRRGWGSGIATGQMATIQIGSLALDIYDSAAKQLIWRGEASKAINKKAGPEKREKNLKKGAAKLLKNFPPKRK